ncbi:MAG TPA: VOC family protein [Kineosporiaceae bacterium]|nr:VOC family protein [Kineosporiaceae bacterium]
MTETALSRTAASQAVESLGWRYALATLVTSVRVASLAEAARVAVAAMEACGDRADGHLRADLRPDRVELSLAHRETGAVTDTDTELAGSITAALAATGHATGGATSAELARPVEMLEIAVDALDIPAVRPFWQAVLAYEDDGHGALVDPAGQLPAVWFQQMDAPRPQRNRIHFDVTVAHDEAEARVRAALDAGGVLVSDGAARSFWILADVEGNEVCVCTWLDRDERESA